MVTRLTGDNEIGGCQGSFDYRCTDPAAAKLLRLTQFASDEALLDHTVSGNRSAFPWAVTGNSMYRQKAIAAAGCFDEKIQRCEDADFSWKVVLSGFRLEFVREARVFHGDESNWQAFFIKHFRYGAGAAQLAHAYNLHGERLPTPASCKKDLPGLLLTLMYFCGYRLENMRLKLDPSIRPAPRAFTSVSNSQELRPSFNWTDEQLLQMSDKIIYWFKEPSETVIVDPLKKQRISLEGTAYDMFRCLQTRKTRQESLSTLSNKYCVAPEVIAEDLDHLVNELIGLKVLQQL